MASLETRVATLEEAEERLSDSAMLMLAAVRLIQRGKLNGIEFAAARLVLEKVRP